MQGYLDWAFGSSTHLQLVLAEHKYLAADDGWPSLVAGSAGIRHKVNYNDIGFAQTHKTHCAAAEYFIVAAVRSVARRCRVRSVDGEHTV